MNLKIKLINAVPLMERLRAAIAFGNEKGLPKDELEQVLADIEGMEELLGTNLAEVGTRTVRGYTIDADAFMEKVAEEYGERARDTLYRIIRYMPPVTPKQRTGKWIYQMGMIKCNQCLRAIRRIDHDGLLNFCPNCGADMTEGDVE